MFAFTHNKIIDFNIVDKLSQFTTVRDPVTQTQFMYNSQGFVSYDDERAICDKTEYAIDKNLNGYIIWEISGDLLYDKSTPLLDATNDRLNTNERCDPNEDTMSDVAVADAVDNTASSTILEGQAWYPNQSLGYCVNDGKELENNISPSHIFVSISVSYLCTFVGLSNDLDRLLSLQGSALACCVGIFSYNPDCTASSLGPDDSSGQDEILVVSSYECTDCPWYPHIDLGYCLKDGNEAQYYTPDDYKFVSNYQI